MNHNGNSNLFYILEVMPEYIYRNQKKYKYKIIEMI